MANFNKIYIKNLKIFAYHGNNPDEKINGQNFLIDCTAYTPSVKNLLIDDNLENTVSYSKIAKKIIEIATNTKFNLIETLAEKIAESLLVEFAKIHRCDIIVKKPEAPIKNADFEYVAVEISRERTEICHE